MATVVTFYFVLIRFQTNVFVGISNVTYSSECIAFLCVSFCPSISGNDKAANWTGVDAFIAMNVHLMPRLKNQITEVFGAFNTPFNSCMKFINVAIQMAELGEVF